MTWAQMAILANVEQRPLAQLLKNTTGLFVDNQGGVTLIKAMPLLLLVLAILAIAYRYYSAFLAARVAVLDDSRPTPAHQFYDGQNYHPTNKWVLFGHHFAAISGAGPLIGPVLAIQYGFMPGLVWLVVGVCLAGAVQDMLVLAASVRRGGKSLAQIALTELGRPAAIVVSVAILLIVIIALAGLGFVVVKALGGETVKLPEKTQIILPENGELTSPSANLYKLPPDTKIQYPGQTKEGPWSPKVMLQSPTPLQAEKGKVVLAGQEEIRDIVVLPQGTVQVTPGSAWGTFTIACTIPIALFVGLYMYKIRKGRVVEASLIGALGVLAATVAGEWVQNSWLGSFFSLSKEGTVLALCGYGFVASVLPVWMLLCPRDYLSSFLKIGTIALLVVGVIVANPTLQAPEVNPVYVAGGPSIPREIFAFQGDIFPFVFICIMCGAISGFHSLVSSGTTPKMIDKESHVRTIGYGSMLLEGLVGVMALIAAASLPPEHYYAINIDSDKVAKHSDKIDELNKVVSAGQVKDPLRETRVDSVQHLELNQIEEMVDESLRGRTAGAVTLAVGMAVILTDAVDKTTAGMNVPLGWAGLQIGKLPIGGIMKYWYHFAIMFEALFILTTIDTGTRIARFLLQETVGKIIPRFEKTDWLPGAIIATAVVTAGWGGLVYTGQIGTIWPMFGIANQLLSVVALCLVTTMLVNSGRLLIALVTLLPMLFVCSTTMTAAYQLVTYQFPMHIRDGRPVMGILNIALTIFIIACVGSLLLIAVSRWVSVAAGMAPPRAKELAR